MLILVTSDCPQPIFLLVSPCLLRALLFYQLLVRSVPQWSLFSGHLIVRLLFFRLLLRGPHGTPWLSRWASPPFLLCVWPARRRVRVRLDSPRDRVVVATVLPCRSCGNRLPVPLLWHSLRVVLGTLSALTPRRHVAGAPCGCPVQRSGLIRPLLLRTDQSLSALWRSRNFRASAYFAIRVFGQMSG